MIQTKVISLCNACQHCPEVKITDELVQIGEAGNLCTLKLEEWEILKQKILNHEI